jgi:hypothetical protein
MFISIVIHMVELQKLTMLLAATLALVTAVGFKRCITEPPHIFSLFPETL